jgi:hypothetical protein
MDEQKPGKRTCPACGSGDYTFRGVRRVTVLLIPVQHGGR